MKPLNVFHTMTKSLTFQSARMLFIISSLLAALTACSPENKESKSDSSPKPPVTKETPVPPDQDTKKIPEDIEKAPKSEVSDKEEVDKYAVKESKTVVQTFYIPTQRTNNSVTYKLSETRLEKDQVMYFHIPRDMQNRGITNVIIGHRQILGQERGWEKTSPGRDDIPAYALAQVHATNFPQDKAWRVWGGSYSGRVGAKFSEVRGDPEFDNLYEWMDYGTYSVDGYDHSYKPVHGDTLKLESLGPDVNNISEIVIRVLPEQADNYIEKIFTPGTGFNQVAGRKAIFGGGQNQQGLFPNALPLGYQPYSDSLPLNWNYSGDTLRIPIPAGKKVVSFEMAGGDTHPDKVINKDGGWGTPGYARLYVSLEHSSGKKNRLIYNENVPPEGLFVGSPSEPNMITQNGDVLVIESQSDTIYVMGIRIGLKNIKE